MGAFDLNTVEAQIAGCMLQDIRLLKVKGEDDQNANGTYIIFAKRNFGHSYGDSLPVTFTVYKLMLEHPDAMGEFAFMEIAKFKAKHKYCSVIDAFRKELGLPNHDPKGDRDLWFAKQ